MKSKKLIFIFVTLLIFILSGCNSTSSTTTKGKTELEKFTELLNEAIDELDKINSYKLIEDSYFNYTINGQKFTINISNTSEFILEPFYAKVTIDSMISNVGNFKEKFLLLQEDDDEFVVYYKGNVSSYSKKLTRKELEEEYIKESEDFGFVPNLIEKVAENDVNGETIVTYEGSMTINDMPEDEKERIEAIFEFYIGQDSEITPYENIEITKQFILNKTTKQIVELNYDLTAILTQATIDYYNNKLGLFITLTNTDGKYRIIFSSFNDIVKDENFINEMKK